MKAILMSIKPKWVAKILNGEKTIEIRKRFPKDYVGWVYMYCTKNGDRSIYLPWEFDCHIENGEYVADCDFEKGNGKVVARFWVDNVDEYSRYDTIKTSEIEKTCLTSTEIWNYANNKKVSFIDISNLEKFDDAKELNEFATTKQQLVYIGQMQPILQNIPLTKAPQSWQYIEVEE